MIAVLWARTRGVVGRVGVIALAVLALLLSLSVLRPGAASAAAAEHTIDAPTTAEVGQKVDPGEQATVSVARVDAAGRMRVDSYPVTGPEGAVSAIAEARSDPAAVAADVAQPITPLGDPSRPGSGTQLGQYGLDMLCIDPPSLAGNAFAGQPPCADDAQAHASGKGQIVALVDTGLQPGHPDLSDLLVDGAACVDELDCVAVPAGQTRDTRGHGQGVAGTVNAVTGNGVELAGTAPAARLMPVRIYDDLGAATTIDMANGVLWAVAKGATVINISSGWNGDPDLVVEAAIQWALLNDVPVVASAGNGGVAAPVNYPAAIDGVIAVGAVDWTRTVATFSSRGWWVDVVAAGVGVPVLCAAWVPGQGCSSSGTSFASPQVAAVVAMLRELHPRATPAMIERQLQRTAAGQGESAAGRNDDYGWGVTDPVAALTQPMPVAIDAAVGGDARATVTFSTSGDTRSGTHVEYSLDHGATWISPAPAVSASPLRLTGVPNDTTNSVRLRMVNDYGAGPASDDATFTTHSVGTVFVPIEPVRVFSTRADRAPLAPQETRLLPVADQIAADGGARGVVPAGAVAVAFNLTVPAGASGGHLRIMPGDVAASTASAINFRPGESIANGQVVKIDADRMVRLFNGSSGATDALVDITGYFVPTSEATTEQLAGGRFTAVAPTRVYDSGADPAAELEPGQTREVSVLRALAGSPPALQAGPQVAPAGASAVAYNITVVTPGAAGHLRVYPADRPEPGASAINWTAGDKVANGLVAKIDSAGRLKVANHGGSPVRFLIDVQGYYSAAGAQFYAVDPARAFDSRAPQPAPGMLETGPAGVRTVSVADARDARGAVAVAGGGLVPAGAQGIAYNLTVTGTLGGGHLRVYPAGSALPGASAINWPGIGYTRANAAVVQTPADRRVSLYNGGAATHALIDILGYYR